MKSKIMNTIEKEKKEERSTIICVDDEKMMLSILFEQLTEWFGEKYRVEKALTGQEALEIIDQCIRDGESISVVISDYMMPIMKGDELLIEIRKRDPKIRKIMLTGYTSVSGIMNAINQAGLYRFVLKPWDVKDLMLTVMEAIKSYEQEKKMQELVKGFESLYRRAEEVMRHSVDALISTIQAVNIEMSRHSMRIEKYASWLAKKLELDENICKNVKYVAALHEIGKLGMEYTEENDEILLKQIDAAKKIISHLDDSEFILKGINYQFEKYDGSGLFKMKKEEIPPEARIIAIVHYYDLLKTSADFENLPVNQTVDMFNDKRGTWFDPDYVDAFVKMLAPVKPDSSP